MTGRGIAATASNASRNERSISRAASCPPNSEMSAPAANAFSPPATTTAFTAASAPTARATSRNCPSNARESAFIGGLFRRITVTPSDCGFGEYEVVGHARTLLPPHAAARGRGPRRRRGRTRPPRARERRGVARCDLAPQRFAVRDQSGHGDAPPPGPTRVLARRPSTSNPNSQRPQTPRPTTSTAASCSVTKTRMSVR